MNGDAEFELATNEYLADLYYSEPVMATAMGVHEYDAELPNRSQYCLDEQLRTARAYLHKIDRLSLAGMGRDTRIDCRLARARTQVEIFTQERLRPWQMQPALYAADALYGVFLLLSREAATPADRAESAASRLRKVPELLEQARQNIGNPPAVFTEIGIESARGGVAYLADAVPAFAGSLADEALAADLRSAAEIASNGLDKYAGYLEQEVAPRSSGDFAIGREAFEYMLRTGHLMEEAAADLRAIGEEEIAAAQQELARLADEIEPGKAWPDVVAGLKQSHPRADELLNFYAREMGRARDFVAEHGLVTLPDDAALRVIPTPAFARALYPYAGYVPAAPFEERLEGLFWVTPVEPHLNPAQRRARLEGHSRYGVVIIALHEGYPGHHLQFSTAARHPSRYRRHFGDSNLLCEGWALYCEEMMYEEGFYSDPRIRLMQLKDQLWRACRVVIDVGLHCDEMSFDEAVRFLVDVAKLEEPHARAEVRRYTANPTQPMSYIVGKRLVLSLRDQARRKLGPRFDLRRFHDDLLSYATIPPRLIRDDMFAG